jgi:CRP/FNR family cyclic AMP-dependent transcriptional regulator
MTAASSHHAAGATAARRSRRPLLALDPELAAGLPPERAAAAGRMLHVEVRRVNRGVWVIDRQVAARGGLLGLLITGGVAVREVVVGNIVSSELLGVGDVVAPWSSSPEHGAAGERRRWQVIADLRIALLDADLASRLGAFPQIQRALFNRMTERVDRLATLKALAELNSVDQRLLGLFRHLAMRWGRVNSRGVVIPLVLSHRLLGELVGARRPTVTTALKALADAGVLSRAADGTWLLTEHPESDTDYPPPPGIAHRRSALNDARRFARAADSGAARPPRP